MTIVERDKLREMYEYLDDLRKSGATNMFGAAPYLEDEFPDDLTCIEEARRVTSSWMRSFDAGDMAARLDKGLEMLRI